MTFVIELLLFAKRQQSVSVFWTKTVGVYPYIDPSTSVVARRSGQLSIKPFVGSCPALAHKNARVGRDQAAKVSRIISYWDRVLFRVLLLLASAQSLLLVQDNTQEGGVGMQPIKERLTRNALSGRCLPEL